MRRQEATARRYARGLFLAAREGGWVEAVGDEIARFHAAAAADRRLTEVLSRPWIKGIGKRALATAVAAREGCAKLATDFLGLVAARGRMDHLAEIVRAYRALVDAEGGRVRAQVRSAVALGDAERGRLAAELGRVVGKEVIVEAEVDPTLLGGFVAQVGSLVLDGSLDGQLARMRERLVRG